MKGGSHEIQRRTYEQAVRAGEDKWIILPVESATAFIREMAERPYVSPFVFLNEKVKQQKQDPTFDLANHGGKYIILHSPRGYYNVTFYVDTEDMHYMTSQQFRQLLAHRAPAAAAASSNQHGGRRKSRKHRRSRKHYKSSRKTRSK